MESKTKRRRVKLTAFLVIVSLLGVELVDSSWRRAEADSVGTSIGLMDLVIKSVSGITSRAPNIVAGSQVGLFVAGIVVGAASSVVLQKHSQPAIEAISQAFGFSSPIPERSLYTGTATQIPSLGTGFGPMSSQPVFRNQFVFAPPLPSDAYPRTPIAHASPSPAPHCNCAVDCPGCGPGTTPVSIPTHLATTSSGEPSKKGKVIAKPIDIVGSTPCPEPTGSTKPPPTLISMCSQETWIKVSQIPSPRPNCGFSICGKQCFTTDEGHDFAVKLFQKLEANKTEESLDEIRHALEAVSQLSGTARRNRYQDYLYAMVHLRAHIQGKQSISFVNSPKSGLSICGTPLCSDRAEFTHPGPLLLPADSQFSNVEVYGPTQNERKLVGYYQLDGTGPTGPFFGWVDATAIPDSAR